MKDDTRIVKVSILDEEYEVSCPAHQQQELLLSAAHLDRQMRAIREAGKVIGRERIAVMAALNLSHGLLLATGQADGGGGNKGSGTKEKPPSPEALKGLTLKVDQALRDFGPG